MEIEEIADILNRNRIDYVIYSNENVEVVTGERSIYTGARTTTKSACDIHFQKVKQAFADAAFDIPNYWMIGNHDVLPYNYKNTNYATHIISYLAFLLL